MGNSILDCLNYTLNFVSTEEARGLNHPRLCTSNSISQSLKELQDKIQTNLLEEEDEDEDECLASDSV
jgi:hypothetical protein